MDGTAPARYFREQETFAEPDHDDGSPTLRTFAGRTEDQALPVCGEEIKLVARKCIYCGSRQDWRSRLGASGLNALIAIVAFLALIIALLKE